MTPPQMMVEIAIPGGIPVDPPIDGLMTDTHLVIIGILQLQSGGNCFWRPVESDLYGNVSKQFTLVLPAVMPCFTTSLDCPGVSEIVPVYIFRVLRTVSDDLTTDGSMVSSKTTSDFS
jgi:hypothetical protein